MLAIIDAQTHRRFVKSHLPFDGLPIYDEVRYIHVGRDPRDACMSLFNHWSAMLPFAFDQLDAATAATPALELGPVPRTPDDLRSFWRRWFTRGVLPGMQDGYPDVSFVELETSYWRARRRENLLLVHYNDLKADLDGEMRRIAAFLGIDTPAVLWPRLVEAASFEAMKRDGPILMGGERGVQGGSDRSCSRARTAAGGTSCRPTTGRSPTSSSSVPARTAQLSQSSRLSPAIQSARPTESRASTRTRPRSLAPACSLGQAARFTHGTPS
jgi:hypothetical protein